MIVSLSGHESVSLKPYRQPHVCSVVAGAQDICPTWGLISWLSLGYDPYTCFTFSLYDEKGGIMAFLGIFAELYTLAMFSPVSFKRQSFVDSAGCCLF